MSSGPFYPRPILISDLDVNDVFGLPQGSRIIPPGHSDLSEVCIEFSRLASSISTKGVHSLKAAEFILSKPLDENSSRVECECFKIAFVILPFGHVLNPCAKHDYTSIDYWATRCASRDKIYFLGTTTFVIF